MEWTTVTVIIALVGLGAAIVRPIVSLTQSITKLTVVVEGMSAELIQQKQHIKESHQRIWAYNDMQDKTLEDHERRIGNLELR